MAIPICSIDESRVLARALFKKFAGWMRYYYCKEVMEWWTDLLRKSHGEHNET